MTAIRWVCLSDTHFGAENSLLTHVGEGVDRVDPMQSSPVLERLVDCLRSLVDQVNGNGERPTLVLNGDVLELALAHGHVAAMAFDRFVELAFARDRPLFADTILYLPGNHDHHIWEAAREHEYAAYVAGADPDRPLEAPFHAIDGFGVGRRRPQAELLTALLRRRAGSRVRVEVAYPNLAVTGRDGGRLVVFHHGHFIEAKYRLMSGLKDALFPSQTGPPKVGGLESDNFAWIDFFWSTFARSLDVGGEAGLIYLMSQDPTARNRLADNLGDHLGGRVTSGRMQPAARQAARLAARKVADRLVVLERDNPTAALSPSSRDGLRSYLEGPLRRELDAAPEPSLGPWSETSFVFGHTHKPFESTEDVRGYAEPVTIYNSGGWVVDNTAARRLHGAAVVLVSDAGEVASLRMHQLAEQRATGGVRFADPPGQRWRGFRDGLAASVDLSAGPWTAFTAAASAGIVERQQLLPRIVRRGIELARPDGS